MLEYITKAKYLHNYVIWVKFSDGTEGEIDLRDCLDGEIFEPLKDIEFFKKVKLDLLFGTICWPNGADFAQEFLYRILKIQKRAKIGQRIKDALRKLRIKRSKK